MHQRHTFCTQNSHLSQIQKKKKKCENISEKFSNFQIFKIICQKKTGDHEGAVYKRIYMLVFFSFYLFFTNNTIFKELIEYNDIKHIKIKLEKKNHNKKKEILEKISR